jgi:hypothetical protein
MASRKQVVPANTVLRFVWSLQQRDGSLSRNIHEFVPGEVRRDRRSQ